MRGRVPALCAAAALVFTGAALRTSAQRKATPRPSEQTAPKKVTSRPEDQGQAGSSPTSGPASNSAGGAKEDQSAAHYVYEFSQPEFFVYFVHIEHDDRGHGSIRFERRSDTEQITDPLEIAPAALARIRAHFNALRFLDSNENYQGPRNYPSQGKTKLTLRQGGRERTAEFNYSQNQDAQGLAEEYRRVSEQALFVFDINVALESQPLETPKLIDRLDSLLNSNFLSDAHQLIPLVRQLSEDERVPLVGRNQAARILKKLEKQGQ
ncbi:MAG TPA: hypothetical protein VE713_07415 [Pyrinomonadaceae bacterium]|nr:hypothetical protein [Pyrinomonadaceae bacterium]